MLKVICEVEIVFEAAAPDVVFAPKIVTKLLVYIMHHLSNQRESLNLLNHMVSMFLSILCCRFLVLSKNVS